MSPLYDEIAEGWNVFRISICACMHCMRKEEITEVLLNGLSAWQYFSPCQFSAAGLWGNVSLEKSMENKWASVLESVLFYVLCNVARDTFMKRSLNQNFGEAIFCFAYLTIYCKSAAFEFFSLSLFVFHPLPLPSIPPHIAFSLHLTGICWSSAI